jgi:hypothetical protein
MAPRLKSRAVTLLLFWVFVACSRMNLNFAFGYHSVMWSYRLTTLKMEKAAPPKHWYLLNNLYGLTLESSSTPL